MKEKLKKIYALAMQGVDGEKEAAMKLLAKLSKKYGVSIQNLDEEQVKEFEMEFHGKFEVQLLTQIVYKITGSNNVYKMYYTKSGRLCRTKASVHCTEAQKMEIEFLFNFYKTLFKKEQEYLLRAFIQKHRLFGERAENDEEPSDLSDEEWLKIMHMAAGLSDESPLKQLEEKIK